MLTIYKASAGSGKTYTLAYEYIKLLLGVRIQEDDKAFYVLNHKSYLRGRPVNRHAHRRILAITFTNKATSEMKERIIRQLESLTRMPGVDGKDAEYAGALMKEFGCLREELRETAEQALRSLLNDYSQFNVSTIDAFFQTILRGFAREIDRQGDYRLELDESTVISQAISMLFDELNGMGSGAEVDSTEKWLEKIAMQRVASGDDFNPFNSNSRMYRSIENNLKKVFNERFMSREKEMYDYLKDKTRLADFEDWLKKQIDAISSDEEAEAMSVTVPADMDRYVADLIVKIQQCGGLKDAAYESAVKKPGKSALKLIDRMSGQLAKKNKTIDEDKYFDWFDNLFCMAMKRMRYEEMLDKINTLQAFVHIHKYIDRFRVENNLILISDTNALLSAIVSEDDTPFIYERVGVSLENFLIDEFQDTSRQQWRNLKPLVANSLGSDADSLIIGDVKQSIYRWRGGDSVLLASEVQNSDFPENNTVKGSRDGENTNYRSAHELVRFNNSLFFEIALNERVKGYEGVAQSLGKPMEGVPGYVRILNLTGDNYTEIANRFIGPEFLEKANAEERKIDQRDVSLKLLGESIMDQISRGYRFDEIAILCRDHTSLVAVAEYIVKEYPQIKLVSDEALLLCNSRAVKLIISILEIIDKSFGALDTSKAKTTDGGDDAGMVKVLGDTARLIDSDAEAARLRRTALRRRRAMLIDSFNYYMAHGKKVEEALPLAIENSKRAVMDADEAEEQSGRDRDLERDLEEIRRIAPSTLPAMVEAIISVKLTEEQRRDEMPYLTAFVDMVETFSRDSIPSIHSFLNYWREHERKFAIAAGEKIDAVSIMTVHKAKGLEWPCVHIPMMKWMLEDKSGAEWFDMGVCTEIPEDIRPPMMYLDPRDCFMAKDSAFLPQLVAEASEQKSDNLNVAYVAFTRAVRELDVHMIDNKDNKKSGISMSDAINGVFFPDDFFEACDCKGIFLDIRANVDESGNYILGSPTVPVRKETGAIGDTLPAPSFHVSFNPLNSQLTRLADLTVPDDNPEDPDLGNNQHDREIVDEPVDPNMEAAARHGLILHSILAQMYTLGDIDTAIEYHRRDIADSELAFYRSELEKAFEKGGERAARWFSPDNRRVLNEQAIYCATDNSNRRADRIIWSADGSVEVVDYKFTSMERDSHLRQVREYAMMLRDMGEHPVRAFLWYPLLGRIVEVDG